MALLSPCSQVPSCCFYVRPHILKTKILEGYFIYNEMKQQQKQQILTAEKLLQMSGIDLKKWSNYPKCQWEILFWSSNHQSSFHFSTIKGQLRWWKVIFEEAADGLQRSESFLYVCFIDEEQEEGQKRRALSPQVFSDASFHNSFILHLTSARLHWLFVNSLHCTT